MSRVLVVDDNGLIRAMLRSILTDEGYEVDVAEDGDVGLDAAHARRPDLIITDYYMARMHGDDLVKALRKDGGAFTNTPIIGLAGTVGSEKKLRSAGVTEYLAKPFMKKALLDTVRTLLQQK